MPKKFISQFFKCDYLEKKQLRLVGALKIISSSSFLLSQAVFLVTLQVSLPGEYLTHVWVEVCRLGFVALALFRTKMT